MSDHTLDINLLGREYRVACAPGEKDQLLAAVAYVDEKMRELAGKTNSAGERLAVMAALNIAHELLQLQNTSGLDVQAMRRRIGDMGKRMDEALAQQEKLFE